jgi:Nuclease-related domain
MNIAENMTAIVVAAVAVLLVLAIVALSKPLRNLYDRFRVSRAIKRLGTASMSNVVISDGMDGHVFIEHLVLTPDKILVVSVRRYSGAIFAAENMDMWAQVTDGGSYKFPNPLHEIETAMGAVRSHIPDAAVSGIILFGRDSTFPKGKPDGVMHISEIAKIPTPQRDTAIAEPVRKSWERLLALKSPP